MTSSKKQRKVWEYQQRVLDSTDISTSGERFTRVMHAMLCGDADKAYRETIGLVRRARTEATRQRYSQ